jgi:hypothetical protein
MATYNEIQQWIKKKYGYTEKSYWITNASFTKSQRQK